MGITRLSFTGPPEGSADQNRIASTLERSVSIAARTRERATPSHQYQSEGDERREAAETHDRPETELQLGLPEQWQRTVRDWVANGFRGEVVAWEELDPDGDDRRRSQKCQRGSLPELPRRVKGLHHASRASRTRPVNMT